MQSFLNEPLRAEVVLLDTRELSADDIRIRLAGVDDFERLGVDRSYFLTSIEFDVSVDPDSGLGVIRLSSPDAVLEPFLDLIIEARWPEGRVLREYTVLVDPPAFRTEVITVSASERVEAANPDKPALAEPASEDPAGSSTAAAQRAGGDVAVRESDLPPGAMPSRAFSAATAQQPQAGKRYMVKRDETLWEIASRGRPDGVSVQQAMLDIQRINPEAFIDGNINRVKAGYIIYLPAAGEVSSADLAAALAEVRAQNRAFAAEQGTPGVSAAATLRVSADNRVVDEASDTDALAAGSSSVAMLDDPDGEQPSRVSTSESSSVDSGAEVAPEATVADNGEVARQLATMAERLDTLEQIVALKDEQIATLEQALREAREAAAARPPAAVPSQPAAVTPPAASTSTTASTSTSRPAAPAPAGVTSLPWMPIGAGALLVLLGGAFVVLRRRRSSDVPMPDLRGSRSAAEQDVFKDVALKNDALEGIADEEGSARAPVASAALAGAAASMAPGGDGQSAAAPEKGAGKDGLDAGGSRGYGERKNDDYIDEAAQGDALAEADIYIAYGRYLQAIELLNTAIQNEPENSAYRLKLTELYVDMGEEESAAEQLLALRMQGDADAIARAEALVGDTPGASNAGSGAAASDLPEDRDQDNDLGLDLELDDGAADEAFATVDPASASDDSADTTAGVPGSEAELPEDEADEEPEFTLEPMEDWEGEDMRAAETPAPGRGDPPNFSPSTQVSSDEPLEFDRLEIEDDLDESLDVADRADTSAESTLSLDQDDEVLDLTDALSEFSDMGLDDDEPELDIASDDDEDLLIADDADQMATKLDLARAYMDMGDHEGARGILQEVAETGSGAVQQEARELLDRIA
ncbi:MAG: FimV/HubP family polar landmark protein [Halieaceae bacterium]|nr:FimV/HubP family polar landmark protein [Halieaceae bacterium]